MSGDTIDLIHGYIEKTLSEEQTAEMLELLRTDRDFRAEWIEYMENESITWELGQQKLLSIQESDTPARIVRGRPVRTGAVRRSWVRSLIGPVAAAAVLGIVVGLLRTGRETPAPGTDPALAALVERAAAARTVVDIKAMDEDVRKAYGMELARGDECRLPTMMGLGIATAITGNVREDRQAKDLRFVLGKAAGIGQAATAYFDVDFMSVAEAAVSNMTAADREKVRELYAGARRAAEERKYDDWHRGHNALMKLAGKLKSMELARASAFEMAYVTFYERGLAYDVKLRMAGLVEATSPDELPPTSGSWVKGGDWVQYIRSELMSEVERMAAVEKSLQDNVNLDLNRRFKGKWSWGTVEDMKKMLGDWYTSVRQDKVTTDHCIFWMKIPPFREAVITGQARVRDMKENLPDDKALFSMAVCFPTRTVVNWSSSDVSAELARYWNLKERWSWFRIHYSYEDDGVWSMKSWRWLEGNQPRDLRTIDEGLLPQRTMTSLNREDTVSFSHDKRVGKPAVGSFGFHAVNCAAEWRALGIQVIRPAGIPAGAVEEEPESGKVLFADDFEKGLGDWTAGVVGKEAVEGSLTVTEADTPGGRSKIMLLDCGKVPGETLAAYLKPRAIAEAVTLEADICLEKTYRKNWTWSLSCWVPMKDTVVEELWRNHRVSDKLRKEGAWIHYRRDMITREEDGKYVVYLTSYLDGDLNSQVRMITEKDPRLSYLIWFSARDVKVGLDNLTIKTMTPDPNWKPMKKE